MANSDFADFYARVTRAKKACPKEYGFEAIGTLDRSSYAKPSRRSVSILGPLLFLLVCGFLMKSVMYQ